MFTSRSFTSLIFDPHSGKESFPLLYPVLDSFNHKFGAKVMWNMSAGDFSLDSTESTPAGAEVFNNYAPKGNEELLNGYGFCIPSNPCDEVTLRIGQPPAPIIALLHTHLPARFPTPTSWPDSCATFHIRGSDHYSGGYAHPSPSHALLRGIPPELLTTIRTILAYSTSTSGDDDNEPMSDAQLTCFAVDTILDRLVAKYNGIGRWNGSLPPEGPRNRRQAVAAVYREGQVRILGEVIGELQAFLGEGEGEEEGLEVSG